MNITEIITEIRDNHCGACKFGLAMRALEQLQSNETIVALATAVPPPAAPPLKPPWKRQRKAPLDFEKPCNKCHVTKPLSAYPKNKTCRDGHTGTCATCTNERVRKNKQTALDRIAGGTKVLKAQPPRLDGRIKCEPCRAVFTSEKSFREHHCLAGVSNETK